MCNEEKPLAEFHAHKLGRNGVDSNCKECKTIRSRARYADPEVKVRDHRRRKENQFGLQPGQYDEMLEAQGGTCAICKRLPEKIRLHVDHCHTTGDVRGLLCYSCNTGLGVFRDDPEVLSEAIRYLNRKVSNG